MFKHRKGWGETACGDGAMVVWKDAHKVDELGAAARIYDDASVLPNDDSKDTGFGKTLHALLIIRNLLAVENESKTHFAGW